MAKPYRSRVDSRKHFRELNTKRNQPERGGIAKVLASAKDGVKAMLSLG